MFGRRNKLAKVEDLKSIFNKQYTADAHTNKNNNKNSKSFSSRHRLKVLSWNVFLRSFGLNDAGGDFKHERVIEIIKHFKQYDIILAQELFGTFSFLCPQIINALKKEGFAYYVSPSKVRLCSLFIMDSGLCIISKYPIVETDFYEFKNGSFPDVLASKGMYVWMDGWMDGWIWE